MMYKELIEKINRLSMFEKLEIYLEYYITMISLKKNFRILDSTRESYKGMPEPTKISNKIYYYYLWENISVQSFEDFISIKNVRSEDVGENWKDMGYAHRYLIKLYGIYEYISKR